MEYLITYGLGVYEIKSLDSARRRLDEIDSEILKLIKKRIEIGKYIAKVKKQKNLPIYNESVEMHKYNKLLNFGEKLGLNPLWVKKIIEDLIEWTKQEEYSYLGVSKKVGILGPEGSFSEEAALHLIKSKLPLIYFNAIEDVFKAVLDDIVDYGIVPIENTTGGTVIQTLECLLKYDIEVFGETSIEIVHCLVAKKPIKNLNNVKIIYSHPQAIMQCYNFIRTYLPHAEIKYATSTSEALKLLDENSVAIASENAARMNNCIILKRNIQDLKEKNITRFYVIRKPLRKEEGDITALFFSVEDKPGSLKRVLDVFYDYKINLRKLESRPDKQRPGKYIFFTEAESKLNKEIITKLKEVTEFLKIVGVFRKLQTLNL